MRGNSQATVDEKGRVKIPAVFIAELRKSGTKFFVTSEAGEFALIYPMKVWEGIEKKLAALSTHNRAKQKFLDRTNYFGQEVELDGQGRLLLPPVLREAAKLEGTVDVLGNPERPACLESCALRRAPEAQRDDAGRRSGSGLARYLELWMCCIRRFLSAK